MNLPIKKKKKYHQIDHLELEYLRPLLRDYNSIVFYT